MKEAATVTTLGTETKPLRVAIIGSGPSGIYAVENLHKQLDVAVEIDMFERLPTPYGLVRGGVAPDHPKIKSVTRLYDRIVSRANMRFFGNVEYGTDITHDDLVHHYHVIIYAVGAQSDRKLGIPGEDLPGSHSATEFVAWYNAHPDFRDLEFDLSQESVAVIGVGNVALDVARILLRDPAILHQTDIADYALKALAASSIRRVYILGRRSAAQAAFTNTEIEELGELRQADIVISPEDVALDPLSKTYLDSGADKTAVQNVQILTEYSQRQSTGKDRQLIMRFLVSPVELIGSGRVEAIKVVRNELYETYDGALRPRATDRFETIPVGLVFRSVGYHGVPLPGVPFNDKLGIIPNDEGRIFTVQGGDEQVIGEYVVGWIKRGPSGVIGTNKPDAAKTVASILQDLAEGKVLHPVAPERSAVLSLLERRRLKFVTFDDWQLLDQLERDLGAQAGRPRLKLSRVSDMLDALEKLRPAVAVGH